MEQIAAGYQLAEAPVASDDGGVLFSDVLGGGVHRWSPTGDAVETIIPKRRGIGGMANHVDGGLVVSGATSATCATACRGRCSPVTWRGSMT